MAKNKRIALSIPEEQWKGLSALAGTFGASAEEVVRQSLADEAVIGLFFQCRVYAPELCWDEVAQVGRTAIRERLRAAYLKGLEEHLARLGLSLESSAEEVEAAKKRALDELKADTARPLEHQIARAQEDSVYLGWLYDAWKRANAGEPGCTIAQVELTEGREKNTHTVWAVLKDGQII